MPVAPANQRFAAFAMALAAALVLAWPGLRAQADPSERPARLVRTIAADRLGVPRLGGLAFVPADGALLLAPADRQADRLVALAPEGGRVAAAGPAPEGQALGMAFDSRTSRLLLLDAATGDMVEHELGRDASLSAAAPARYPVRRYGAEQVRGMAIDPRSGRLFLLDGAGPRLVSVEPSPGRQGRIARIDLAGLGLADLAGLALHPGSGHLYTFSAARQRIYELTQAGALVASYRLPAADLRLSDARALVFGASGDQTDDPAAVSLYIAERRQADRSDQIAELDLTPPEPLALAATTVQPTLVQIIDTSQWSPPSPDPMDITYLPGPNRLVLSDAEVEEAPQPYWRGANVFELRLSGSLSATYSTLSFTNEPAGIAYSRADGLWYFSDDDQKRVSQVDLGADETLGTADDVVTSFVTLACGDQDPESVAVDAARGHLILADGLNSEVYDIAPGPNGVFDGCAPDGDDRATHFDTNRYGIDDPEAVEVNPENGHLYITGNGASTVIETTRNGALVTIYDIAFLKALNPSGVAYAPSSIDPQARSLYITARGLDNASQPRENDGKIYEIALPGDQGSATPTRTPTRTPTPTRTATPTRTPTPIRKVFRNYLPLAGAAHR